MEHPHIVCIDFGSAYTKVGVRADWDSSANLVTDCPLATAEVNYCIPSVVARIQRGGAFVWVVGEEASNQVRAPSVEVFENFKAKLFGGRSSAEDDALHDEVAAQFFLQLRKQLGASGLPVHLDRCAARICVPKLAADEVSRQRIGAILNRAGWQLARERPVVYEPESNACGVFTRGRNSTWFPPRTSGKTRYPYYRGMFEHEVGLVGAMKRGDSTYGLLVVDVGAFTTDFAYLSFNLDDPEDMPPPRVAQVSERIGVRQLDDRIKGCLPPAAREALDGIAPSNWESGKRRLYRGEEAMFRVLGGGTVRVGAGEDVNKIQDAVADFASQVTSARSVFLNNSVNGTVNAQMLTGGGSMIPLLREQLLDAMKADGKRVYDLLDDNEPFDVLAQNWGGTSWNYDEAEVSARRAENQQLVRGGSAIGGCSVFFEGVSAISVTVSKDLKGKTAMGAP